jgi:hypothetical protein
MKTVHDELKRIYQEPKFDADRLDVEMLKVTSAYQAQMKAAATFDLIRQFSEPGVREDALWLLTATAVRKGEAAAIWKVISPMPIQRQLTATDRGALSRGFVDSITSQPAAPPQQASNDKP